MIDKKELLQGCEGIINQKLNQLQKSIEDYKVDLLSETKSSAGDKHETGRAMLQLEMEKLGKQYQNVRVQKQQLEKIDEDIVHTKVSLGTIVETDLATYFIATSVGQVEINGKNVLVISPQSPIGNLLMGRKVSDAITFSGNRIVVESIS